MSCLHPLLALYDGEHLKIINKQDASSEQLRQKLGRFFITLPCGKCIECRKNYAMEKAVRCACEAKYTTGNFFITLTYKETVANKEQAKKDLKDFIDKLRKLNPELRYFGCIEKGEANNRIHAHINLFNLNIDDGRFIGIKFKSDKLEKLWGHGLIDIKPFDTMMAQYTAGYTAGSTKKTLYITQSRNLGANYILDNKESILETGGTITIGTHNFKMGRWGYKILEKYGCLDIKPYREEQARQTRQNLIEQLRGNNLTLDDYFKQEIENKRRKRYKKKGGDNQ